MKNIFEKYKDKATRYVDVRVQLAKLSFIEKSSHVLGTVISMLVMLFLGNAAFFFLGLSLMEFFINLLDGNRAGGTLLTAGFFALLIGVAVLLKKPIVNGLAGIFIKIMTAPDEDDEHEHKIKVKGDDSDNDDDDDDE